MTPDQIATKADVQDLTAQIAKLQQLVSAIVTPREPEWLSLEKYAESKSVTIRTVNNWIANGKVKARGAGKLREVKI